MVRMRDPCDLGFRGFDEMLRAVAEKHGTCVAFHEKKQGFYQHVSYGRLLEECEALRLALGRLLPPTPRVLLVGENSYPWVLSFLSLLCGAGVPVLVDSGASREEIAALAARCDACAVLCDGAVKARVGELSGVTVIDFEELARLVAAGKAALDAGELAPREVCDVVAPAVIFCEALRTGEGKCVALSRKSMLATLHALGEAKTVSERDIFLAVLPFSRAEACMLGLLYPLSRGASVAFGEGAGSIMRNMREIHPTCMVAVPYLAKRIYDKFWELVGTREAQVRRAVAVSDPVRPLSARQALKERLLAAARAPFGGALRYMLVVGEPLSAVLSKGLRQIGIFAAQCYGMAECAGVAAMTSPGCYRDGTVGRALSCARLDIEEKQADGSGEILVGGDGIMLGYEKNGAETAAVLHDGRYATGDMGRIDSDGFLHIIGKKKNCILRADGTRISPEEIEQLLMQSPLVHEAAVVGVTNDTGDDIETAAMILPDAARAAEFGFGEGTGDALERAVYEWLCEINKILPPAAEVLLFALSDTPIPRDEAGRILRDEVAKRLEAARNDGLMTR